MIDLEINETVIFELRRHWFAITLVAVFLFAIAMAPTVFVIVGALALGVSFTSNIIYFLWFLCSLWALTFWVFFAIRWTDYYLDVWLITNKRVIDIDQKGLFNRDIATVRLESIQDVKVKVEGVIQTLLKIGDIQLQTAAEDKEFELMESLNPEQAKFVIQGLIEQKQNEIRTVRIEKDN